MVAVVGLISNCDKLILSQIDEERKHIGVHRRPQQNGYKIVNENAHIGSYIVAYSSI